MTALRMNGEQVAPNKTDLKRCLKRAIWISRVAQPVKSRDISVLFL